MSMVILVANSPDAHFKYGNIIPLIPEVEFITNLVSL